MKKIVLLSLLLVSMVGIGVLQFGQVRKMQLKKNGIYIVEPKEEVVWIKGTYVNIRWERHGLMQGLVQIHLIAQKSFSQVLQPIKPINQITVVNQTANNGLYKWKIPKKINEGRYILKIQTINNAVSALSKPFLIRDFSKKKVDLAVSAQYLGWTNPPQDPEDLGRIKVVVRNLNHSLVRFPCCNHYSESASSPYCFSIRVQNGNNPSEFFDVSCSSFPGLLPLIKNNGWGATEVSIWDPGWFPLKITVDSTGKINESNENNNTVIVPKPTNL